jgi:hypothetical protein
MLAAQSGWIGEDSVLQFTVRPASSRLYGIALYAIDLRRLEYVSRVQHVIADGDFITADEIRRDRFYQEVAVGTVRAQIKAIFAKTGVNRQIELVARLSQL